MSAWTDPETGNSIAASRFTDESFTLSAEPTVGELYLDDLRELVARCAHLPGNALLDINSIRIAHRVYHGVTPGASNAGTVQS